MKSKQVAILIEDHYQEMEVWYPFYRLQEDGFEVVPVAPLEKRNYKSKLGYLISADKTISQIKSKDFAGVIIPGGWAPDKLRASKKVLDFVREMDRDRKTIAAICHAGWVLASADIIRGRIVTSYYTIKDDLIHAGARYVDKEVVQDGNLITSRHPNDLPVFMKTVIKSLKANC